MKGITHAVVGASCGLLIAGADVVHHPELVGLAVLGSLLPDIDHQHSTIGHAARPVSWIVTRFVEHRGPTHSILFAIVCGVASGYWLGEAAGWALWLGCMSHILTDSLNKVPVPWLWPAPYSYSLKLFKSGSIVEWPISLLVLWLTLRVLEIPTDVLGLILH